MAGKTDKFPYKAVLLLMVLGLGLSLFSHWEPGGESWGYWTFVRIFTETGKFILNDRSPIYELYINLFWWMGYPASIITEYLVSTLITLMAMVFLFRRYLPWPWLTLAVVLWIPYLQSAEPPVARLALACVCFAVALRDNQPDRFKNSLSYALMFMAGMFRVTFILCLWTFLAVDIVKAYRHKIPLKKLTPSRYDWPIVVIVALFLVFQVNQSPHRWNNPWGSTCDWFLTNHKSLLDSAFIENYNYQYQKRTYPLFKGKDMYFTNQDIFKGAKTIPEAIRANPKLILKQLFINVKYEIIMASKVTLLPDLFDKRLPQGSPWWYPVHILVTLPILFIIFNGAFRACQTENMRYFLISLILMLLSLIITMPRERYMHPMMPIVLLSMSWYIAKASRFNGIARRAIIFLIVMAFSAGVLHWLQIGVDVSNDIPRGTVSLMHADPYSMDVVKPQVEPLVNSCKGVLSFDHRFWAAFSNLPLDHYYDIYEIPPFGTLDNSVYKGLRPDRIDCLVLSGGLITGLGIDNVSYEQRLRFENYIKPYRQRLENLGAKTYKIPSYGTVTVLGK